MTIFLFMPITPAVQLNPASGGNPRKVFVAIGIEQINPFGVKFESYRTAGFHGNKAVCYGGDFHIANAGEKDGFGFRWLGVFQFSFHATAVSFQQNSHGFGPDAGDNLACHIGGNTIQR